MNNIVELNGLQGVKSEKVYAYFSTEPKEVQNALELGIACTGADDNGAYNIYFDDEENICCEYMQRCVTKEFKKVETIEEAAMQELMSSYAIVVEGEIVRYEDKNLNKERNEK